MPNSHKLAGLYLGLLLIVFQVPILAAPEQQEVDLSKAFEAALKNTERVEIQKRILAQAEERLSQAKGSLLPTLSVGASYTRLDNGGNATIDEDNLIAKTTLSQPLFKGFREYAGLSFASDRAAAEKIRTEDVRLSLYTSVAVAFYDLLSAVRDAENIRTLLDLTQKRVQELKGRVRIGRSRKGELLAAQSQVASVQAQLAVAEGKIAEARDQFAFQTGLDRSTSPKDSTESLGAIAALDHYLGRIDARPDIQALQKDVEANRRSVTVAFGGHLPTLDFIGNYYIHRDGSLKDSDWDVGLALSIPIFQGGVVRSQVREAAAKLTQAELSAKEARRRADTLIRVAYQGTQSAMASVDNFKEALRLSEQNYNEQKRDYQLGLVTNLDVLQALNAFVDNKRALDRAGYQTHAAYALLRASAGDVQ